VGLPPWPDEAGDASVAARATHSVADDLDRVHLNAAGQTQFKLEATWRDGTSRLTMSPLQFIQRLSGLVPSLRGANPTFRS
jgi:hypothetical protein